MIGLSTMAREGRSLDRLRATVAIAAQAMEHELRA